MPAPHGKSDHKRNIITRPLMLCTPLRCYHFGTMWTLYGHYFPVLALWMEEGGGGTRGAPPLRAVPSGGQSDHVLNRLYLWPRLWPVNFAILLPIYRPLIAGARCLGIRKCTVTYQITENDKIWMFSSP